MITQIVTIDQLKQASGYKRLNDLENWLIENGIRYLPCKAGFVTTTDAFNAAMGLKSNDPPADDKPIKILS